MSWLGQFPKALLLAAFVLSFLAACDSGGGMDGDDPPQTTDSVTVSAEAVTEDGARVDSAAILFDGTQVGTGQAEKTYEEDADREVTVRVEEDDFVDEEETVSLGSDQSLSLEMLEELPETVTVSFENRAADGDSLIAGTVSWEDSVIAEDVTTADRDVPASRDAGELCFVEGEFFNSSCTELTPTGDQDITLSAERKSVTVAVTPVDSTSTVRPEAKTKVYEPYRSDSASFEGEGSVERPKRSGQREVVSDWVTEEDGSDKLDRYRSDIRRFAADADADFTTEVSTLIPACSDSIDNDGDGFADEDDTRACTDLDGNYDPQDDNEILKGFTRGITRLFDDSTFVSKSENQRTAKLLRASSPLPYSVMVAKGEITHEVEMQVSDTVGSEDHASHLKTGASNDNLTVEKTSDIIEDADTANGFTWRRVHGIDRSFFADGPYYALYGWHGSKARGNPPSSGGKFYYYAELEDGRGVLWSYVYEPEDVPDDKQKSAPLNVGHQHAPLESGECARVSKTDTICRVPAGEDF